MDTYTEKEAILVSLFEDKYIASCEELERLGLADIRRKYAKINGLPTDKAPICLMLSSFIAGFNQGLETAKQMYKEGK